MTLIDRDVDVLTDVETLVREWLDDAAGRRDTAAAGRSGDRDRGDLGAGRLARRVGSAGARRTRVGGRAGGDGRLEAGR